jgi:hypothetical protein
MWETRRVLPFFACKPKIGLEPNLLKVFLLFEKNIEQEKLPNDYVFNAGPGLVCNIQMRESPPLPRVTRLVARVANDGVKPIKCEIWVL